MTDYFVVTHGNNERQVQAIARAVKEVANEQNIEVKRMEGYNEARWILIDLADVVVHVFHKDERNYYNIEKLYQDAPLNHIVRLRINYVAICRNEPSVRSIDSRSTI